MAPLLLEYQKVILDNNDIGPKIQKLPPQDIHYFKGILAFFEAIPDEKWCTGTMKSSFYGHNQYCALGHIAYFGGYLITTTEFLHKFRIASGNHVALVNDGHGPLRPENTPKGRVCGAIKDILKNQ